MNRQFDFRALLLKIQDLLSDNDRERFHFLIGEDIPRHLRDDASLGGTLRVLQSLFDKAFINDQDCDYLLIAFKKIGCNDAAKRLQEYQKNCDQQSLSLKDILWHDNVEDKCPSSGVFQRLISDSPPTLLPSGMSNDIGIKSEPLPSVHNKRKKYSQRPSCLNAMFQRPFSTREVFLLILIIILFIGVIVLAFRLSIMHWRKPDQNVKTIVSATIPLRGAANISLNATWSQYGVTVFGNNRRGSGLNQLSSPWGLFVDDNATIYIVDSSNNRIVKSKCCIVNGQVVAGGNGAGNRTDQLNEPKDVIVNRENDNLFICDRGNRRVMQWPLRCGTNGEIIISNIECQGLTMDDRGFLYVSDTEHHNVTRWQVGNTQGLVVAGGNGKGDSHNQLTRPSYIFVDRDYSVYVSDTVNHRIMKWTEGAKKGIVVAGGRGEGKNLTQLAYPRGVVVDHYGIVYVADSVNDRIMRWFEGEKMGRVLVGGKVGREQPYYLYRPDGLSFDRQGNLYVNDMGNHRVLRFSID